jgi:Pyridoxamine 5'-phosphate oxidase
MMVRTEEADMDQKNLAELYHLEPVPWSRALELLEASDPQARTCFLATTRPDGRPHLAGVGAVWQDGKAWFVSGPGTRKSQNVAADPHVSIGMSMPGIDLVIEGTAQRVTDDATLPTPGRALREGRLADPGR